LIKLSVKGANLDAFLNRAAAAGFELHNCVRLDHISMVFSVEFGNYRKLVALFRGSCYTLTVIKLPLQIVVLNYLKAHIGVPVGLGLACAAVMVLSLFVWRLDITGLENLSERELRVQLAKAGLYSGAFLPGINPDEIELKIKMQINEISTVSVSFRGSTAVVNLLEKVRLPIVQEDISKPVVASADGLITHILVLEGTPMVRVGDSVRAGQTLIAPYTTDINGTVIPTGARGEITAQTWYTYSTSFTERRKVYVRTGRNVVQAVAGIFGKEVVLRMPDNPFADFETETRTIYAFGNNFFPAKITYTYFYETKPEVIELNPEKTAEIYKYEAKLMALEQVPVNQPVLEERFSVKQVENTFYVTVYLKTSQTISIRGS